MNTTPIRLLKIVPTLLCGGTENQAITLARALHDQGFSLEVACLRRVGPFVKELSDLGIPLSEFHIPGFYSFTALVQKLKFARHMARKRIDVMHAYSFYGNVFGILPARLAATPVVIASIRDRGAYLTPMQKRVQRFVCRFADCVLVNADAVKDWLTSEGYNPAKIVVIPNGVELDRFTGPSKSRACSPRAGHSRTGADGDGRLAPHAPERTRAVSRSGRNAHAPLSGRALRHRRLCQSCGAGLRERPESADRSPRVDRTRDFHRPSPGRALVARRRNGVCHAVAERGALERAARIDGRRRSDCCHACWRHTGSHRQRT